MLSMAWASFRSRRRWEVWRKVFAKEERGGEGGGGRVGGWGVAGGLDYLVVRVVVSVGSGRLSIISPRAGDRSRRPELNGHCWRRKKCLGLARGVFVGGGGVEWAFEKNICGRMNSFLTGKHYTPIGEHSWEEEELSLTPIYCSDHRSLIFVSRRIRSSPLPAALLAPIYPRWEV